MTIYTIVVTENAMIAHDGLLPRARLRYIAPNLRIYTLGAITTRKLAGLMHMAVELCIACHIPAFQLTRYVAEKGKD